MWSPVVDNETQEANEIISLLAFKDCSARGLVGRDK